jgi:hypothetical protein
MKDYMKAMSDNLLSERYQKCERNGVDQGLHNVLIYKGTFANPNALTMHSASTGPVNNMQVRKSKCITKVWQFEYMLILSPHPIYVIKCSIYIKSRQYKLAGDAETILNKSGQVVAVAHQYDRDKSLLKRIIKKYQYWEDAEDDMCEAYNRIDGVDGFKGRCDMGVSR